MNFGGKHAKLVSLMHKIIQRRRIKIFCSECTDPPHWTPNSCFGAFQTVPLLQNFGAKWGELVHRNFSQ
jgi:hypothetical protein